MSICIEKHNIVMVVMKIGLGLCFAYKEEHHAWAFVNAQVGFVSLANEKWKIGLGFCFAYSGASGASGASHEDRVRSLLCL